MTKEEKSQYAKDWYQKNKERRIKAMQEWAKNNPESVKASKKKYIQKPSAKELQLKSWLKVHYGLTLERFQTMEKDQGGVCKICKGPPIGKNKRLSVDHDHVTNEVRGLLCSNCNFLVGQACDNIGILQMTIDYLSRNLKLG